MAVSQMTALYYLSVSVLVFELSFFNHLWGRSLHTLSHDYSMGLFLHFRPPPHTQTVIFRSVQFFASCIYVQRSTRDMSDDLVTSLDIHQASDFKSL